MSVLDQVRAELLTAANAMERANNVSLGKVSAVLRDELWDLSREVDRVWRVFTGLVEAEEGAGS